MVKSYFNSLKYRMNNLVKYYKLVNMEPKDYKFFLEKEYIRRTGERPNLDNPQKYTEKMQYAKVHLNTPLKSQLSDKFAVREWIKNKIGEQYLIPIYGVWKKPYQIDFNSLPEKYILKLTSGSGTNYIVKDKNKVNKLEIILKFYDWMSKNFAYSGDLQLHYADIEPQIMAEKNIKKDDQELVDYRFICFDGEIYYCWVDFYTEDGEHYSNIYDLQWNLQPWRFEPMQNTPYDFPKPENFDVMIDLVKVLSQGFSHVRVDLYNVDGNIYFGEMTFTTTGGYRLIHPEKYNYELGALWDITGDN